MQKNKPEQTEVSRLLAKVDELYAIRQAALEAENQVQKVLLTALFEAFKTVSESNRNDNRQRLMTLQELAVFIGYGKRNIQDWISDKEFPDLRAKAGADPRFDLGEVLDHMKRHRKNNRTSAAANDKVKPLQRDCKRDGSKANVSL